ncbi:MAG: hypothetical protein IPO83_17895 [Chitinophagaceae bacterium]|nr:hypothetical protein [Chitinophagaceae bacterium]
MSNDKKSKTTLVSQTKIHVTGFAAVDSKFMERVTIDQRNTSGKIPTKNHQLIFAAKWQAGLLCAHMKKTKW